MVEICRCAKASFKRIGDDLQADAELAGALAVDVERCAQAALLRLRRDVAEQRIAAHFGDQPVGPFRHLGRIGAGQRVLVLRAARLRRDLHVLHRLEIDGHAGDRRRALLQPHDDSRNVVTPLAARLQRHHQTPDIGGRIDRAGADHGDHADHVRIGLDRGGRRHLPALHLGKGNVGTGLGHRRDRSGILQRQKALRRDHIQDERRDDGERTSPPAWRAGAAAPTAACGGRVRPCDR